MLDKLISFRKKLHMYPELSGQEENTSNLICDFLYEFTDAKIIKNIGGFGLAAIFEYSAGGPVIMIRCDTDALAIQESNTFEHRSIYKNISHKCGHDGHMAIVSGLGIKLSGLKLSRGKVILLYQPAEETGKGAKAILNDPKFKEIKPDYIFALHNLPGFKKDEIIIKEGLFTPSVQSFSIKLNGKRSHAAQPEKGINPAGALAELIQKINSLYLPDKNDTEYTVLTPVFINMGKKNYGISPGHGELHYTLRTMNDEKMAAVIKEIKLYVDDVSERFRLTSEFDTFEFFPAVYNHHENVKMINKAAAENKMKIVRESLAFGEDFACYTQNYKAAIFGLGAGKDTPLLHYENYDFPDDIIETGIHMFESIIKQILN